MGGSVRNTLARGRKYRRQEEKGGRRPGAGHTYFPRLGMQSLFAARNLHRDATQPANTYKGRALNISAGLGGKFAAPLRMLYRSPERIFRARNLVVYFAIARPATDPGGRRSRYWTTGDLGPKSSVM